MVDDNLMKRLIETKLKSLDLTIPFMMYGYPRKINQAHDYDVLTGYNTPKNGNLCDNCNVELISRTDDTKESYEKRFDIYMT